MLILQCIIGLQSQNIGFKNSFDQEDIPREEQDLIENPRYFNSDGGKFDVVIIINKILYGQVEYKFLWYEKF